MSPEVHTEVPGELVGEAHREGRGRLIAVATVLTTMLAALTGFLQASALRTHDEADARAERLGALSVNAASANKDAAQVQIERFQLLQQQLRQQANAHAFDTFGHQAGSAAEAVRWKSIAANTEKDSKSIAADQHLLATCPPSSDKQCLGPQTLPVICSPTAEPKTCGTSPGQGGWFSPEEDPNYPTRYEQAVQREAFLLSARRDAANEQADAAENRFVHFTAALTLFAVAVFLFGYSLTPQGQRRRNLFVRVAAGFVVAGGIWALVHVLAGSPQPPEAAAVAYADGQVALNGNDYVTADKAFSRAVDLRDKFVDAWVGLSAAKSSEGFPAGTAAVSDSEGTQITSVSALKTAIHADQRAIDSGSQSPVTRFGFGADLLYLGLLTHNDGQVAQSRSLSADAANRFEDQLKTGRHPGTLLLNASFNAAEADLVLGSADARLEYRRAEQRMLDLTKEITLEFPVGEAITDLSIVAQTRPKLAAQAEALKAEVVAAANRSNYWFYTPNGKRCCSRSASRDVATGNDIAQLTKVQITPDPGHAQFTIASARGLNLDNDLVGAQWEYKDPVNGNWEVLPDISGTLASGSTAGNLSRNSDGSYTSLNPSFLNQTAPHTCLPSGQYRVSVYVNGKLAGQSAGTNESWGDVRATGFRGIDAMFCRPAGWHGVSVGSGADLFTDNGTNAAVIFVLPKKALGGLSVADAMRKIVTSFASGSGGMFSNLKPAEGDRGSLFMNFSNSRDQLWGYDPGGGKTGALYSGAGVSSNGELYVGLVYGTDVQGNDQALAQRVFNTLLSYSQL